MYNVTVMSDDEYECYLRGYDDAIAETETCENSLAELCYQMLLMACREGVSAAEIMKYNNKLSLLKDEFNIG